ELHDDGLMQQMRTSSYTKYCFFENGLNNVDFHNWLPLRRTAHNNHSVLRAGNRALDQHQVLVGSDLHDLKILNRNTLMTPLPRHFFSFTNSPWKRTIADGTAVSEVFMGAVRSGKSAEGPTLDDAREAMAFGNSETLILSPTLNRSAALISCP